MKYHGQDSEISRSLGECGLNIINDILDYSKLRAEQWQLKETAFSLRSLVHDVVVLLQSQANRRDLELWIDYPPQCPDLFIGDRMRVRQILLNLIGNAVKFTPSGHIGVTIHHDSTKPGAVTIAVSDTGIGISESKLATVFSEFEQVDSSSTREVEGTGLGLAISRSLAQKMKGNISVTSIVGKGSTFIVDLCLRLPETVIEIFDDPEFSALSGKKVAVVDDLEINRLVLSRRLEAWGAFPFLYDGAEAFLEDEASRPLLDAAILDMDMPKMTGVELQEELRKLALGFPLPVILYTSHRPKQPIEELRALGFTDYLLKPARSMALGKALLLSMSLGPKPEVISEDPEMGQPELVLVGVRVLVAEDNRTNRLVVSKMLESTGAEVYFAANGKEALEVFKSKQIDIVLMDMSMPVMDGLEATRLIRQHESVRDLSRTAIVALTANAHRVDADACRNAGMDDFISKPVRKHNLISTIKRWKDVPSFGRDGIAFVKTQKFTTKS